MLTPATFKTIENVRTFKQSEGVTTREVTIKEGYIMKEIKEINKEKIGNFLEEQERLKSRKHPNIVHMEGFFISNDKRTISIFKEGMTSNLYDKMNKEGMSNVEKSFCIYQIAEGMKFIHSKGIIHNGLKPSNIMIGTDGKIKIDDIGQFRLTNEGKQAMNLRGAIKTLYFISPEIKRNREEEICEKADVYSFGAIVYFIMNSGSQPQITLGELLEGKQAPIPTTFTANVREIIEYCCHENASIRPSFNEIVEYLKNPECRLIEMTGEEQEEYQRLINEHQKLIQQI